MKKLFQFTLLLAFVATANLGYSQKKVKEGSVKFEMSLPEGGEAAPEMAMMAGSTLDFYFNKAMYRMDMSMMGGMMRVQTFIPNDKPKEAALLFNMMGKKIQLTDVDEELLSQSNSFINAGEALEITYDKSVKKKIAGYDCYLAKLKMPGGMEAKYFITEKIKPPSGALASQGLKNLKGYPLEISVDLGMGGTMTFTAKEVTKGLQKDTFKVPEGYEKMTMEQFQEQMGGMMDFGK